MANKFRDIAPARTCTKKYGKYNKYKTELAADFHNRCGYTDCPDWWFGGPNTFHIDHFLPWKKNPHLKTEYSNLVYSCSYINILKSDDEDENYLDPCNVDYNNHFYRDELGCILPSSPQAQYMYKKLRMYMRRYQIIWMLDKLYSKMAIVKLKIEQTTDEDLKSQLLQSQGELGNILVDYLHYLRANQ